MDYPEAIRHLYGLTRFGIKLGLDNTRRLAALAGDPHDRLKIIHVAGTNGKGSTCAVLENIYRHAGLRVGLYTSPHLISFRERIQVNRELIPEADVCRLVEEIRGLIDATDDEFDPTFFEFVTVMALRHFAERNCDLVILETGMGGRFDSTNIVTPIASVITPIAMDHQQFLGDTLAKIAGEKAGIVKPGVPVVSAPQSAEAEEVLHARAAETNSPLHFQERLADQDYPSANAALAETAVCQLNDQFPVNETAIADGKANANWPGRMQFIERGNQTIILDGAHNPAGFAALVASLKKRDIEKPPLLLGILGDKDTDTLAPILAEKFGSVTLVPVASNRSKPVEELAEQLASIGDLRTSADLSTALSQSTDHPVLIIAGSFYLIGDALEILGALPEGTSSERELNEWAR